MQNPDSKYVVKMNGTPHSYFPSKKYAETFVRAQKAKKAGQQTAFAAKQTWTVEALPGVYN